MKKDATIIGLISSAHGMSHFYQLLLAPLFPFIKDELGVSYAALGFLVALFYTLSGLLQPLAGFVVDRYGARSVLLTGVAFFIAGVLVQGFSSSYATLALGAALGPFGLGVIDLKLDSPTLRVVATLSLALVLFTDAVSLNIAEVKRRGPLALRLLGPGTLLSAALIALAGWWLLGLSAAGAAMLGAALASSDPVPATGPYVIERHAPGDELVLVRNPNFREWSPEAQPDGYPDRIVYSFGHTDRSVVSAIEEGRADWGIYRFPFAPSGPLVQQLTARHASQVHVNPLNEVQWFVLRVNVPPFMAEVVSEMSQQARRSPHINQRSGVSVRMSVANYETLVANATRRALRNGEDEVVPRISDLPALVSSTTGKVEIEALEEGREGEIVDRLVKGAVLETWRAWCRPERFRDLVAAFESGLSVDTGDDVPSSAYADFAGLPGIKETLGDLEVGEAPAEVASAVEFVLEGLHLSKRLNKEAVGARSTYRGRN